MRDAHGDKDLNDIVKQWFGEKHDFGDGCKLGDKATSSVQGVYDVGVVPVLGVSRTASDGTPVTPEEPMSAQQDEVPDELLEGETPEPEEQATDNTDEPSS